MSQFSGWNEMYGASMERNSCSKISRNGEADRRLPVLQLALISNVMHLKFILMLAAICISGCSHLQEIKNTAHEQAIEQFHGRLIVLEPTRRWQVLIDWKADKHTGYTRLTHAATNTIIELKWQHQHIQIRNNHQSSQWQSISQQQLRQYGIILPPQMIAAILQQRIPRVFKQKNATTWQGIYQGSNIRLQWHSSKLSMTDLSHGIVAHLIIQP